jgi:hypothetical protein
MHSLRELNDFLTSKEIEIKEFGGWYLKVGKDTWTITHDVFYRNGMPQSLKEKGLFDKYKKVKQNGKDRTRASVTNQGDQTRKWRGISSRNYR